MLRVLTILTPEMKPPRIPQGVDTEVNFLKLASHLGDGLAPAILHLLPRLRLKAHRRQGLPQGPLGANIVLHEGDPAPVAPQLTLPES